MRLGKLEKEILDWMDEQKESPSVPDILHRFARYTKKAGDRNSYSNYSQISRVLDRLEEKNVIIIINRRTTNSKIIRVDEKIKE